jgi:hypothetical protein
MRLVGENGERIVHEEILTNPLMLYQVADLEALEEKQQELLAEDQKKLAKLNSDILKEKVAINQGYEQARIFQQNTEEAY